jgi:pyruvate dehydrogenase E2 component (dihydrolipoamide acetyltransferase)
MYQFKLPDLGEGVHEGQVVNVLIKQGEQIAEDQPMLEVETDKAAVEIPSPKTGVVKEVRVEAGQTVKVGQVMVVIDEAGAEPTATAAEAEESAEAAQPAAAASGAARQAQEAPAARSEPLRTAASSVAAPPAAAPGRRKGPGPGAPAVRKLAREMGVDINAVPPSGPNGRVMREDVERAARGEPSEPTDGQQTGGALPAAEPLPDFDQWGPVRREQPPQIRKTIARQMTRAWLSVPRVTHCDQADVTDLDRNRKALNERLRKDQPKLTMTAIVVKAVAVALREYPMLNCSYDAAREEVLYKDYVHVGIAVDTPRGLVVPVLRDVGNKSLPQIAAELHDLAQRAREAKFEIAELRGATFTITNVGPIGGSFVTPMVNFPEVGILGLGRAAWQPQVMPDMTIAPRLMLPLSLSFDHRICDGADAARFTRDVIDSLQNPLRLISFA